MGKGCQDARQQTPCASNPVRSARVPAGRTRPPKTNDRPVQVGPETMVGMATIIAFHAHPDDEVLLTGGTLARLAAEGNRTVIVVACVGGLGHAPIAGAGSRFEELRVSASRLGAARVVDLGYADSGHGPVLFPDPPDRVRFARADLDEAAAKLADLIREEHADVLLSYDAQGGLGHRDHVKVHQVGARAAQMAGSVRVLEATLPRELGAWVFRPLRLLRLVVRYDPPDIRMGFSPRSPVRDHASRERAPVRTAEASGTGGSRVTDRPGRPRLPAVLGAGPAARPCLRAPARTRVVRRARHQ
jgi:LmbE family N-acetylglucosaminyl deacetylase